MGVFAIDMPLKATRAIIRFFGTYNLGKEVFISSLEARKLKGLFLNFKEIERSKKSGGTDLPKIRSKAIKKTKKILVGRKHSVAVVRKYKTKNKK